MFIVYFLIVFSIFGQYNALSMQPQHNVIQLLAAREHGNTSIGIKKKLARAALCMAETPQDFIDAIPEELAPRDCENKMRNDVYEKNDIMDIVPAALNNKDIKFKENVLMYALKNGHRITGIQAITVALMQTGAGTNLKINQRYSPLLHTLYEYDSQYVMALLTRNINPRVRISLNYSAQTEPPLWNANTVSAACALLTYGAQANFWYEGETLLHRVAYNFAFEADLMWLYCQMGMGVNLKGGGWNDSTALHILAEQTDSACYSYTDADRRKAVFKKAEILSAFGADPNIKNQYKQTVFDILDKHIHNDKNSKNAALLRLMITKHTKIY